RVSWSFRVAPCWSSTTSNLVSSRVSQRRTSSSLTARRLGARSVALVAQGFGQDLQRRHLGRQFSDALSLTPDHGVLVDLGEVAHSADSVLSLSSIPDPSPSPPWLGREGCSISKSAPMRSAFT